MDKYIVIADISRCPSYRNVNARLLYLHCACRLDTSTYTYSQSLRNLAWECGMTVDAVRHALKLLERDGLITTQTAPHPTTRYAPQHAPQPTTQIHIVTIKEIQAPSKAPSTTPSTTPNTTLHTTDCTTDDNKNNKKNKKQRLSQRGSAAERKTKVFGSGEMGGSLMEDLVTMMIG